MLLEIGCILGGIPLGWSLRRRSPVVRGVNAATSGIIYVLLFLLGVSLGGNRELLGRLTDLGLQGLLIGLCCAAGSAVAAWMLHGILLRTESRQ